MDANTSSQTLSGDSGISGIQITCVRSIAASSSSPRHDYDCETPFSLPDELLDDAEDDKHPKQMHSEPGEDANHLSDRFLISVKPAGLLFASNFIDVTGDGEGNVADSIQLLRDPISGIPNEETVPQSNVTLTESILCASDDEFVPQDAEDWTDDPEMKAIHSCFVCQALNANHVMSTDSKLYAFCSPKCLNEFRLQCTAHVDERENTNPLRKCAKCWHLVHLDEFLMWEALHFCNEGCLADFQRSINRKCMKCSQLIPAHVSGRYCVRFGMSIRQFCKTSCLISYKKSCQFCAFCQEEINDNLSLFCSERCKLSKATTLPATRIPETGPCSVCHQMKDVEVKVRDDPAMGTICSERCLVAYKFVNKIDLVKCEMCPTSFKQSADNPPVFKEGQAHHLCSTECMKIFLIINRAILHCAICRVKKYDFDMIRCVQKEEITNVCSLHCLSLHYECNYSKHMKVMQPDLKYLAEIAAENDFSYEECKVQEIIDAHLHAGKVAIRHIIVHKPRMSGKQKNRATMCKPRTLTRGIQCAPKEQSIVIQTDDQDTRWIPIPVPLFVLCPLHLYVQPVPVLTPIPLPLVVPIFILTGRKSMKGVRKEIQKIKSRIPADPLEAEILMMADMAAGVKRTDNSSDSDEDGHETSKLLDPSIASPMDTASTSFSDDVLSMAFKMANDYTEPLDLESEVDNSSRLLGKRPPPMYKNRGRPPRMLELTSKPDDNLALKFSFGVNAWKQWASMKNHELQKVKNSKFIKLDLLQLSAEDLCYCLCQFVKEVRKPNGTQYASDTIYYLCLGIQLYLYENGRIDNLFCDPFYEKFTGTFNDICLSFCQLYTDNQYIVTRVEEEHLWESKQLGAHSPLVLLNTLLFFNTKHFNLTTVEDHLQLSFSHIMKHWKRNANAPSQRNVLLRFYPPQKTTWGRRKVYEQQECLENPLRCPVRLYEFFLSKCPESVKTRNDVFYLQPERSCVPDSPVWYSTMALDQKQLEKMLNRMKMIKEISMAILGT